MHDTALSNCRDFFNCYSKAVATDAVTHVVEIGSQDVNGSLRQVCPPVFRYTGLDFVAAPGVDVVLTDPYLLPFETSSVDIVLSSSCLEHSEMFWLSFLEALRILKPSGLLYLNVPSNGQFHRYPVDCWRFYPDSGVALVTWAKRNGIQAALLESFTSPQVANVWNDCISVFLRDERLIDRYRSRILDKRQDYTNGLVHGSSEFSNFSVFPEDKRKLEIISRIISNEIKVGGSLLKSKKKLEAISKILSNETKV